YRRSSLSASQVPGSSVPVRRGFTVMELLVVTAILVVLAAILLPVLARTREAARQTHCASNLCQIGKAIQSYVDDHEGCHPPGQVQPMRRQHSENDERVDGSE